MSAISEEIVSIETYVNDCLDHDTLIDPKKIKRLYDLRRLRLEELVSTHAQRLEIMKTKIRELTGKMVGIDVKGKPDVIDRIHMEMESYDKAAVHWVLAEPCLWEESQAYSIAAGVLVLLNEIH